MIELAEDFETKADRLHKTIKTKRPDAARANIEPSIRRREPPSAASERD